jgi:hypothetical protein
MTPFDPIRLMRTLTAHGVRYVVIGGVAAAAHGSPSDTYDLDITYERTPDNLQRLAAALVELKARLRGADDDVPFQLDAQTLEAGDHFTFTTVAGDFDILGTPSGSEGFDRLSANAVPTDFDGLVVLVASVDDLIRMKLAAGRPKDRAEAEILGALRDVIEEEEGR